jgi:hypothetical protein
LPTTSPNRRDEVDLADGNRLRLLGMQRDKAIGAGQLIMFALSVPAGVATSVLSEGISQHLRRTSRDTPIESVRLVVHEQVETTDVQVNARRA